MMKPIIKNRSQKERGVTMLETAITLPLLIVMVIAIYDLGRIYTTIVLCQDISLMAAKLAVAADPKADTPTINNLIKAVPDEDPSTTGARKQAWTNFLNRIKAQVSGKNTFTDRELKTLNLAYGYLNSLNQNIAFPIPEVSSSDDFFDVSSQLLGGATNCSITFLYDATDWGSETDADSRHRQFYATCALPLTSSTLLGGLFSSSGLLVIERTAYAYQSGPAL
jgi:hypothetical protein